MGCLVVHYGQNAVIGVIIYEKITKQCPFLFSKQIQSIFGQFELPGTSV